MHNPFIEKKDKNESDSILILESLNGNIKSLERLILRHQAWIYNISLKMVMDHDDAEDITQEVILKAITHLSTYDCGKGAFRTWLYRIMANHLMTMKKTEKELLFDDLDSYFSTIDRIPDNRPINDPLNDLLAEELKLSCFSGMLLCFNRKERLAFILGVVFNAPQSIASEIMDISSDNFRTILSRARKKLYDHLHASCGIAEKNNRCKCGNKLQWSIHNGWIKNNDPQFNNTKIEKKIRDDGTKAYNEFKNSYYTRYQQLFRDQPFYDPPELLSWLSKTLEDDHFKKIMLLQ